MTPLDHLTAARSRWVDIHVEVSEPDPDGGITVRSTHVAHDGEVVQRFSTRWADPDRLDTEYGYGLSIVHDVKDHIFYGLGLTPLTEIQTIVQTYYGRSVSGGTAGVDAGGDPVERIREHVLHELVGEAGRPLVYDKSPQSQTGLLALHSPEATDEERDEALFHMCTLCEDVMLPPLRRAYRRDERLRRLQASPRDQAELVARLLGDVVWADRARMLLRLIDNAGLRVSVRAYVDDALADLSAAIRDQVAAYVDEHDLLLRYGRTFDVAGYLLPRGGAS